MDVLPLTGEALLEPRSSGDSSGDGVYMMFDAPRLQRNSSVMSTLPIDAPASSPVVGRLSPPAAESAATRETGYLDRAYSEKVFPTSSGSESTRTGCTMLRLPPWRGWLLWEAAWLGASLVFAISGAFVGLTLQSTDLHRAVRSICYFVSLLCAAGVVGRTADIFAFACLDAVASMSVPAALVFYYVSAFRGVPGNLLWVFIGLGTYDSILDSPVVPLQLWLNALIVCGVIAVALGLRSLAYKLFLTEALRGSFGAAVESALRGALTGAGCLLRGSVVTLGAR
jgi:hypothetical protein